MLNTLSTIAYDPGGYVELQVTEETTPGETRRRVNRVATLDGSAAVNDGGFSEADRTIDLAWINNATIDALVDRMTQFYTRINVSTRAGVFRAVPEVFTPGGTGESRLRLLVISKLSV
jgi:hypothetical protein